MSRPTIVILGPAEAGKSTLIRLLGDGAVNLEHRGRTVGMDHAMLRDGDREAMLLGVPGQERFSAVREILTGMSSAAVWVRPPSGEADTLTAELLASIARPLPYLVFVNQRDGGRGPGDLAPAPAPVDPPRDVVVGNLLGDPSARERLRNAMWRLVAS